MYFPLVSVIVPVYNVEKYLDRCIESIVNQTYKNLEIFLVDDGSTDNSAKLCDEWSKADVRIRVIHKENQGPGAARNSGIDVANGKYIFFIDSDDFIHKELVEKCVNNAEEYGSDAVFYGRSDVFDDGSIIEHNISLKKTVFDKNDIINEVLPSLFTYELGFGVSLWSKMFRLDTIKKFNLRLKSEKEIIAEDSYFCLEYFSNISKVTVVPDNLYFYYKRNTSYSRAFKKDRQIKNDDFMNQCVTYVENNGLPLEICSHIKARYHGMTLGTIMQIAKSDISRKDKKILIKEIYKNETLHSTLTDDVMCWDAKLPKIFWRCLKFKLYILCDILLFFNVHK